MVYQYFFSVTSLCAYHLFYFIFQTPTKRGAIWITFLVIGRNKASGINMPKITLSKWWSLDYNILVFLAPSPGSSSPCWSGSGWGWRAGEWVFQPLAHLLRPWLHYFVTLLAGFKIQELPGNQCPPLFSALQSGKGAILQVETPSRQEADSLSALGQNCSDRFISSRVPAIRCKTWAFVSRGKAAAKGC